jgi:6-phosphofructokinase 2
VPVTAVFPCGGVTGQVLAELVRREGFDFVPVDVKGNTRINVHVEERSTNAQYRFNMPGPRLSSEECDRCVGAFSSALRSGDIAVISGSLGEGAPEDLYRSVAVIARAAGARVVLDTSGPPLAKALEAGVWLLKPNLRELSRLADCSLSSEEDIAEAARSIVEQKRAEAVVISMAAAGCLLVSSSETIRVHAPVVRVASRIGAGDSMAAGMVACVWRGGSLAEAARFGVAAGTAAVCEQGTSLCDPATVERLYREMQS